jgi:hypothetical protein
MTAACSYCTEPTVADCERGGAALCTANVRVHGALSRSSDGRKGPHLCPDCDRRRGAIESLLFPGGILAVVLVIVLWAYLR